jgi:hypothetical protein
MHGKARRVIPAGFLLAPSAFAHGRAQAKLSARSCRVNNNLRKKLTISPQRI